MSWDPDRATPGGELTTRGYASAVDLIEMRGLLMAARAETDDWRYLHVGELMWNFFMVLCHLNPAEHIRLWHDAEGRLVAYAMLGEDPFYDWAVLPELAGSGLDEEALAWAEMRLAELRGRDPAAWAGSLISGARQDDAPRIAFLERHGFRRGEYGEVNMLRWLDEPIPAATAPAGWIVRAVDTTEIADRAGAEHDVWSPWPVGNINGADYARLMALPGYERELDIVAVAPDGAIAAYVNGWADPVNRIGDFGPVGTRAAYRRQGLARATQLECLRRMKARGMERVCVSTGEGNTAARGLYESVGFRVVNAWHEYVKAD